MDLVQKSINAIQQTASNLGKRVTSNFGWAGQQAQQNIVRPVQQMQRQVFTPQNISAFQQGFNRIPTSIRSESMAMPSYMKNVGQAFQKPELAQPNFALLRQNAPQNVIGRYGANLIASSGESFFGQGPRLIEAVQETARAGGRPTIPSIVKAGFALGSMVAPTTPFFQGSVGIQTAGQQFKAPILETLGAGMQRGQTGVNVAPTAPKFTVKTPIGDIDPVDTVGQLIGFPKNPTWAKIFPVTSRFLNQNPTTNKVLNYLITRGEKGGTEGLIQAFANINDKMSPMEVAKMIGAETAFGVVSEVATDKSFELLGKAVKNMAREFKMTFKPQTPEQKAFSQQGFAKIASDAKPEEYAGYSRVPTPEEVMAKVKADAQRATDTGIQKTGGVDAVWNNDPTLKARIDTAYSRGDKATVDKLLPLIPEEKRINYLMEGKVDPEKPLSTLAEVEKAIYKSATPEKLGGERTGAGVISNFLRSVENSASDFVRQGELHPNPYIRNFTRILQGFSGGMGKSRQLMETTGRFKGTGINYANQIAVDAREMATKLLDNPVKSLERIHAVLHPDFSDIKVSEAELTKPELEVLNLHRVIADYTNDTNYKNGFVSKETWEKNRGGKYATNIYDEFEYPVEMSDIVQHSNLKPYEGLYKAKTEVTDWKKEHVIRDPIAAIAKRMNQTIFNDELSRMMNSMAKTQNISAVERPGYVKLSDSPFYGDASGKWIRKTALDDIRGQFFVNKMADNAYRLIDAYDKNPLRQLQKKILTIFNPGVQMGNAGSNYIMSAVSGIDPVTFTKNQIRANSEFDSKGQIYRKAMQDGIIGTDILRGDIIKSQSELEASIKDPNIVKKLLSLPEYVYGKTDDIAKLSSLITWLDRGYTWEEAARKTYNSYQNYRHVGWMYNVGAKLPLVGNPFVRFAGDMVRIAKNAAIDHPIALISTIGMWKMFTDVMSTASGETPEERKLRENRFGSAHIPLTDISLAVQTPWGEVNIARLVGASAYMTDGTQALNDLMRFSPAQNPFDPAKWSDPILAPVAQTIMDKDFRGKSIADPNQNKYRESSLTPMEQNINRAKFLARAYVPKLSEAMDITSAAKGEKDFYGRVKSLPQQLLRTTTGIKVEKYGPEQVQEQIDKDLQYKEGQTLGINKRINTVVKDMLSGNIDESIGQDRVKYLETLKPKQEGKELLVNDGVIWRGDKVQFQKTDGTLDSYDFSKWNTVPTNNIQAIKQKYDAIKFANTIMENENLTESQKAQLISRLPVKEQDVIYYNNASMPAEIKEMMIQDEIQNLINQGKADLIPQYLASQRQSVAGKMMLTDTLLNKLASDGQISYSLRDAVKNTTVDEKGNFVQKVKVSKPKSFKMKKITIPKIKAVKATKSSKLKTVKVPKFKALKVPKIGKIKAK